MPVPALIRELLRDVAALLWPTSCLVCGAADRECCQACAAGLRRGRGRAVWVRAPSGTVACVAGPYAGALRELLVACKHAGRTGFARELGEYLRAPLRLALERLPGSGPGGGRVLLVAAPSRAARVRERGYRHVELIVRAALRAERAAERSARRGMVGRRAPPRARGAPRAATRETPRLLPRGLRALPGRTGQVGRDAGSRRRNASLVAVSGAARRRLRGARVVLVDDVITTGATVEAACAALTEAGARVVAVIALCAVERRDTTRHARNDSEWNSDGGRRYSS